MTAWPGSGVEPPMPVLPSEPLLERFSRAAWGLAAEHVIDRDDVPASPFMDEGFDPETLWIWDTCLMAHYAAHAPDVFPGIESLDNFYGPLYRGETSGLVIHHSDNPPLFAWTEWEYLQHTGDLARARRILSSGVLQRHHRWFDDVGRGAVPRGSRIPTTVERTCHGYRWSGVSSGMDNTPRAPVGDSDGTFGNIFWLDAMAQQALDARSLSQLARVVGDSRVAEEWAAEHARLVAWVIANHWNPDSRCFEDRWDDGGEGGFTGVVTPAAFWAVLAGAAGRQQVGGLAERLRDPQGLGGTVPWPSVERRHPDFRSSGHYWRGGVWVPLAYVGAKALAENGQAGLAHSTSLGLIRHMATTWAQFEPHTIWEAYSPSDFKPATAKDDRELVRPDFCGWSALAPTSMLFEHVLGFRVDALAGAVHWTRHLDVVHGITNLRCGSVLLSVVSDGGGLSGGSSAPVTLIVDGRPHRLPGGSFHLAP